MERLLIAVGLAVVAVIVVRFIQRRRPARAPTEAASHEAPARIDRSEFASPEVRWLIVVFSSETCEACQQVLADARRLVARDVAVEDVTFQHDRDRQEDYGITAVPTTIVVGPDGVVQRWWIGSVRFGELAAALRALRRG
jgi:invasion protein IalB